MPNVAQRKLKKIVFSYIPEVVKKLSLDCETRTVVMEMIDPQPSATFAPSSDFHVHQACTWFTDIPANQILIHMKLINKM